MRPANSLAGLLLGAAWATGCSAQPGPKASVAHVFFVSNNTRTDLSCALWSGTGWLPPFVIKGGFGWTHRATSPFAYIRCAAPSDDKPYRIMASERYSLLRDPGSGTIIIHRITA